MIRTIFRFIVPAALLLVVACRGPAPVYNVNASPVVTPKPATALDVEKAILRAGATLGWQMVPQGPGKMEGVLVLRTHRAVVDIDYDAKSYGIKYKDSSNLQYDGTNIHPNYNGWIQNLDKAIRAQMNFM